MFWFRIDNRLVHGQVIEAWLPYLQVGSLLVVNDAIAADDLQQQIIQLAVPGRIKVSFIPVASCAAEYARLRSAGVSALFLLSGCADVRKIVEQGVPVPILNVGNMHYSRGKRQLCAHVAVSEEDVECFRLLRGMGTTLDFRCVPGDAPMAEEW